MFIYYNNNIINSDCIEKITCNHFLDDGHIHIFYKSGNTDCVYGVEATNVIMKLAPGILEGKRAKYIKNAWVIHNLIGHPLMQILSWLGFKKAAIWMHEKTIPSPIVKVHGCNL